MKSMDSIRYFVEFCGVEVAKKLGYRPFKYGSLVLSLSVSLSLCTNIYTYIYMYICIYIYYIHINILKQYIARYCICCIYTYSLYNWKSSVSVVRPVFTVRSLPVKCSKGLELLHMTSLFLSPAVNHLKS